MTQKDNTAKKGSVKRNVKKNTKVEIVLKANGKTERYSRFAPSNRDHLDTFTKLWYVHGDSDLAGAKKIRMTLEVIA